MFTVRHYNTDWVKMIISGNIFTPQQWTTTTTTSMRRCTMGGSPTIHRQDNWLPCVNINILSYSQVTCTGNCCWCEYSILDHWCCNHHSHDSHDCDFCWLNVSMVCRLQLVTCVMIEWQGMVHPECSMITLYSCIRLFHYAAELEMSIIYCYCFITIHSN